MPKSIRDARPFLFVIAGIVLSLDRYTKNLIERNIPLNSAIPVIPGIFQLTHVLNPGAAFSMFADSNSKYKMYFLIAFSLIALSVVLTLLLKTGQKFTAGSIALSLIFGGAIGNLWDRLAQGEVTDFLEVHIIGYHWPDFNLADSAIVCGAVLLIAEILFQKPHPKEAEAPVATNVAETHE
jgi:signal peptidase II